MENKTIRLRTALSGRKKVKKKKKRKGKEGGEKHAGTGAPARPLGPRALPWELMVCVVPLPAAALGCKMVLVGKARHFHGLRESNNFCSRGLAAPHKVYVKLKLLRPGAGFG